MNEMLEMLHGEQSRVVRFTLLFAAIGFLLRELWPYLKLFVPLIKRWVSKRLRGQPEETLGTKPSLPRPKPKRFITPAIFILAYLGLLAIPEPPLNQRMTSKAWRCFKNGQEYYFRTQQVNSNSFNSSIRMAGFVIGEFEYSAKTQQVVLTQHNVPLPPTGAVGEDQRTNISARGLINDVATCYFIKGRSLEYLGQTNEARQAYQNVTSFPHARTWDPAGFFWSPSEAALGRLEQMTNTVVTPSTKTDDAG